MINKKQQFYKLNEIANWQLNEHISDVGLPALQRGYVWKAKQVETLWDSLLRGFPIGSFLISENEIQGLKSDLLDGQQRATAIAMGYYNPWNTDSHPKFFSNKFKNIEKTVPILWLDIGIKEDIGNGEKSDFLFFTRLITQSHPWGYNSNGEKLNLSNRRNAKNEFDNNLKNLKIENEKYPYFTLKLVYPWVAEFPIPLVFLIEAISEDVENWEKILLEKCSMHLNHIKLKNFKSDEDYITKLKEVLTDETNSNKIKTSILQLNATLIPIITLESKHLLVESNKASDDNSTLFIRINTLGTSLGGEELIYSIFKTVFPKSKELVEDAGAGFINPSRLIVLISRIVLTKIEFEKFFNVDAKIPKQPNLKQFKEKLKDDEGLFFEGLKIFTDDTKPQIKLLFSKLKRILIGEKEFQLPIPLAIEISKGNPDILFILLYWLDKTNINLELILQNEKLHKKILAFITAVSWFGTDTSLLIEKLSKNKAFINGEAAFWENNFNESTLITENTNQKWMTILPKPNYLRNLIERKITESWELIFKEKKEEKQLFVDFFKKLNRQYLILLFTQRKYLNERFVELQWDTILEDINSPYDWDHIYPDSWWAYNIPNLNPITKEWRSSIGNFRVLALEDNRSEGNRLSPKDRLEQKRNISFITDSNWLFWQQIDDKINENQVIILAKAISDRVCDIYEEWYNLLLVEELFGSQTKAI